ESLRGVSGGKGSTDIQAKVSGLCEAIERYSGIYNGDEYSVRGTYPSLLPQAIHPNTCMGFSEEQYRNRAAWNDRHGDSRYVLVPHPFEEDAEIDWTPVWSLSGQRFHYLPTAYLYYDHPDFHRRRWCFPDSNGTAAGNTLEEAMLQGFMELVERDAVALWWYNRLRRRRLDLDSFKMPYVDAIREHYARMNREIWVLDITSDLPIPAFVCVSWCTDRPVQNIIIGFGAHFDPKIALLRSITEVNQFLPSVSLLNADGSTNYLFGDQLARKWWTTARVEENEFLLPLEAESVKLSDIHDFSSDDLLTDIETCLSLVREKGMDFLVLDQTRPDIGLNVVKVIVPQLCHFWRRLGKERLYDVPVQKGWLDQRLTSDQLNPWSIFF
ncbi:MAG: YcaO-like family protein, partial [Desulfobacteraceae bacterium]|nr:YcaO-like family protein [Desulfobacteraceae bacterium]